MPHVPTTSYWIDTAVFPPFPKLDRNLKVDVVVVGGGITGITAAYHLKKAGRTVALVERARCATIDTGHTTAHLTCVTDASLPELVKTFGNEGAKAVWDAGGAAIDRIVANIRAEDIDCDFKWVPGYLHAPLFDESAADHTGEFQRIAATAAELGIHAEYLPSVPYFNLPGVEFPQQALFHPRKYLHALLRKIPSNGCHVYEATSVDKIENDPLTVHCGAYKISCDYVVLATHNPLTGVATDLGADLFQSKLVLYTSYVVGAAVPPGLIPQASFWDTNDPYYYLRVDRGTGTDYAIFGGEDHKTGQEHDTESVFKRLEQRFLELVPEAVIDKRWSGQVIVTNDSIPYIGETAKNQFAATGFAGNGMTFGTLGGMMAVDAALHRYNPWQKLFDPSRKQVSGGIWDSIKQNAEYPYYLIRDRLAPTEGDSPADVAPGEGKIISLDGRKVAAFRNAAGKLSLCSPVCTHLKCIVDWNNAEQTWDCPCHGSRFQPTGEVISGPAERPLEKLPTPAAG
jgi:glycine/D-amino acid oxidase-like deaminating enzyme/nitrite reductase/ring-hydroxylating ferredoxin subunit